MTVGRDIAVGRVIAAPPVKLYELVSDVTEMGRFSPETVSCRWLGAAGGPVIGARFKGTNRQGWRWWSTTCTVVAAERGARFAFDVDYGPLPVSRWSYDFQAHEQGCRVVETWVDRRPSWMVRISPVVMGVSDREAHNADGMRKTLAALALVAEDSSR
ncbi:MAG: SRPBCC family protein [Acidimicrobiales bacterium]